MRLKQFLLCLPVAFSCVTSLAQSASTSTAAASTPPIIKPVPTVGADSVKVRIAKLPTGYTATLYPLPKCSGSTKDALNATSAGKDGFTISKAMGITDQTFLLKLDKPLAEQDTLCVAEKFTVIDPSTTPAIAAPDLQSNLITVASPADICSGDYNDCSWFYQAIGGVEQSDLSSQNSQTNGFAELLVRAPAKTNHFIWGQVRFLGSPNQSNTSNISSAIADPTGSISSTTISTVGVAIDYVAGFEYDRWHTREGKYSFGLVAGGGAVTPLSSQTATIAYAVPAYGTNECTQLQARLSKSMGYMTPLPGPAAITTTTTTSSGTTPTTTTSPTYCSVNPIATSTVTTNSSTGVTTTVATTGTQITDIAFAPQDRSNFLLKYYGGLRIIDRTVLDKTKGGCQGAVSSGTDNCSRAITDILIGQDESITGGVLHKLVFRTNITFPIRAGVYLYASASMRNQPNMNQDPLILTPVPIASAGAAATTGQVTIPSPSVFVFPLKQSNRDFYRFGVAVDVATVLSKLFGSSSKS